MKNNPSEKHLNIGPVSIYHLSLLHLALIALSTSPLWVRLAAPLDPLSLGFWRLFISMVALGVTLLVLKGHGFSLWIKGVWLNRNNFKNLSFKKLDIKKLLNIKNLRLNKLLLKMTAIVKYPSQTSVNLILASLFFVLHLWTYMLAIHNTLISHVVIIYSINPLFTAIGEAYFFKQAPPKKFYYSYFLAFTGILLVALDKTSHFETSLFGDFLSFISAGLHALYLIFSRKCRNHINNLNFSFGLYLFSALGFLILSLFISKQPLNQIFNMPFIVWLGVIGLVAIPTFLGHSLVTQLLSHIPLNAIAINKLIEPPIASLMAYLFLAEKMGYLTLLGFIINTLAIVLFYSLKSKKL